MKITMSSTRIVLAARYSESQRTRIMGFRRELAAIKKTRDLLVSRRTALRNKIQSETTANPKRLLQRELGHVRDQIKELASRKTRIESQLSDIRLASIMGN